MFSDYFSGNKSSLVRLNALNSTSKIWRRFLNEDSIFHFLLHVFDHVIFADIVARRIQNPDK